MTIETKTTPEDIVKVASLTKSWVYSFSEGDASDKQLLGGKGANLCAMAQMGINVPPGFVITTEGCRAFLDGDVRKLPNGLMDQVRMHLRKLEEATGRRFGDPVNPLLLAIRSGSALSMPGMMDTILNLGLDSKTAEGLILKTGDARFVYDSWRRFLQLFSRIALGVPEAKLEEARLAVLIKQGVKYDRDLDAAGLKAMAERLIEVTESVTGKPFPSSPDEQLELAISAVFSSWFGKRAADYRREFRITPQMANGTAVNVVSMVFGNMGNDSATGVGFTRDPGTGENVMYGEYLTNAQGEEVVAGIRTPKPVSEMVNELPEMYRQLQDLRSRLERNFREVQDFEYTIEKGVLYCLQTRNGKMNARAYVRTSVEMVSEGLLSREEALLRIKPAVLEQLLHPALNPSDKTKPLVSGIPASPGAATGKAVFTADEAVIRQKSGEVVILIREETRPEDIHGFFASAGVLTSRGGKTSHAAVVARGMGKPCVAGVGGLKVSEPLRQAEADGVIIREGDTITIDGGSGMVYLGAIPMVAPEFSDQIKTLLEWADAVAHIKVRANADTTHDASRALEYGAAGIGLCRTERMFNAPDRLPLMTSLMVAADADERGKILAQLRVLQLSDFSELFRIMAGRPVTIRLLDPPLHEFLPGPDRLRQEIQYLESLLPVAEGSRLMEQTDQLNSAQSKPEAVREAIRIKTRILNQALALREVNPMLGHRGVRLGITRPDIYAMQIGAIMEAAATCLKSGIAVKPEIMVPQVALAEELMSIHVLVVKTAEEAMQHSGEKPDYAFGTMMEVVRACLCAGDLARTAAFFSFGTNDLTQAVYSFSRDDAEQKFLPAYLSGGLLAENPFEVLDESGVGRLMAMAVKEGRAENPHLQIGICGEHGGHPESIAFCAAIGLDYVSCSAPRVPVARLAAAHAKLKG